MAESLIVTKFLPPWALRPAVPRPQLVARLRTGLAGPITLLCAPAGFGKTCLVLQALDGYEGATAWLSLEPDDAEPTRFAHYHALFADLLRTRLVATAGATVAALHRRATVWYAATIPDAGIMSLAPAMHHHPARSRLRWRATGRQPMCCGCRVR